MENKVRLNKYLAECGVCSRRKADEMIAQGRVDVNGKTVTDLATKINPVNDDVIADGDKLKRKSKKYYLMNKPKLVVTTTSDEKGRTNVTQLIKTNEKIFPVGRLDMNTTGTLLLTNDGDFANGLAHPSKKVEKEYLATLDKPLLKENVERLLKGVYLDKKKSVFASVTFPVRNSYKKVQVVTVEGRNHIVKRMFGALGYNVKSLHRVRFGNITADQLNPGEYVELTEDDIKQI